MLSATLMIDVVMGGPGREAEVSRCSGAAVAAALRGLGHDVREQDIGTRLDLGALRPEALVVNMVHGLYGEDGTLQAELAAAGRPFLGSDAAASALCMDKARCKEVLRAAGLPVPWGVAFAPNSLQQLGEVGIPDGTGLVLKPVRDGSSVGLRLLDSASMLLPALEEVVADLGAVAMLLEERLRGPEYTVGLIGGEDDLRVLPAIRVVPAQGCYDYDAKYCRDDTCYEVLADTDPLQAELARLALASHRACGCRDLSRVDLMLDDEGRPRVLEINTLPGFTDHSLLPKAAAAVGLDFPALCQYLVALAARRNGMIP